eukprot:TRINITY_DN1149_c0_g2_i1.p1 TRINITY_DN1149_c0_g2~~TRINITY_DN1149_c0_g2_i1.p1  ORF type:complete len:173 (-),score=24.50 TRINITY_DN1149_c0_g2_i1:79-597(-)
MPEPKPHQWGVFTGTAKGELLACYYHHQLVVVFGVQADIARIVVEYANHGFAVGQQIDVKNLQWRAAEVLTINDARMRIHYVGWPQNHDEWIHLPSTQVAHGFVKTQISKRKSRRAEAREAKPFNPKYLPLMIAERCLGINSHDEAVDAYARYGNHYQAMINGLRFENRLKK